MMIPPTIRLGYPSQLQDRMEYICLIRDRGWYVVTFRENKGFYADVTYLKQVPIYPHDILCWMPQDGS